MKVIPGLHDCGREMDLRITDVKATKFWVVYGLCKKCNILAVISLLKKETEPIQDVDFYIDYNIRTVGARNVKS
jgi:hypothetical protein